MRNLKFKSKPDEAGYAELFSLPYQQPNVTVGWDVLVVVVGCVPLIFNWRLLESDLKVNLDLRTILKCFLSIMGVDLIV